MTTRVGIFGGTFDPPHVGHLVTAINVSYELRLDRLLLVVAHRPWQKLDRPMTSSEHRFGMVRAAVEQIQGLEASDIELRRGGDSYTIDTLHELQAETDDELTVIVGSDTASGLDSWHRAEELRSVASFAVVDRPGGQSGLLKGWRCERVSVPQLNVSSSDIRARVRDGRPLTYLLTVPVVSYIRDYGLYKLAT
ncbi:MAG: nicotinate-nucleotide adenylyltransferase [Acidimicrobiales bacterium]